MGINTMIKIRYLEKSDKQFWYSIDKHQDIVYIIIVILLYQRLGAFFVSMYQFIKFIYLNLQTVPPVLKVGKLRKLLK